MPSRDDGDDPLISATLEAQKMEDTRSYMSRGRAHKDVSTPLLLELYRNAFRDWSDDPTNLSAISKRSDYECELNLRSVPLPFDQDIINYQEKVADFIRADYESMTPDEHKRMARQIRAEMNELLGGAHKKN